MVVIGEKKQMVIVFVMRNRIVCIMDE